MNIVFLIVGIVAVIAIAAGLVASRYKIASPTEALIITGRSKVQNEGLQANGTQYGQRVVIGGGAFVLPLVQSFTKISLESQTIGVSITGVPALDGILLDVDGVAVVKVNGTESSVLAAAQRFGTDHAQIRLQAQETLAGALRSVVGQMTVQSIISDRKAFATKVIESVKDVIDEQGLQLDTFQIQKVDDKDGYLKNLGRPQAAKVEMNANIAEAEATRESEQKKITVAQVLADSERALSIRQSEILAETQEAAANAAAAQPLAVAAQAQKILEEQEKVETRKSALKERELEVSVRKPADAERYRIEQEAAARKASTIADAEGARQEQIEKAQGETEKARLQGQGELALATAKASSNEQLAQGNLALAKAEAEAIRAKGEAQADATRATGLAEADAMREKAAAFKEFGSAAILDTIISTLPAIAHEFAAPMANIKELTVVSTDGASAVSKNVTKGVSELPALIQGITGVDLNALIKGFVGPDAKGETIKGSVVNDTATAPKAPAASE